MSAHFKNMIIIAFFISFPVTLFAQQYYINAYGQPDEKGIADIYIKSIDLNSHSIQHSIKLDGRGNIWFEKPVIVNLNNHKYLITVSEYGGLGRNTYPGGRYIVFYSILRANDRISLLRSDSLIGATIDILRQYQGEQGFRFGIRSDQDSTILLPTGLYSINNTLNFRLLSHLNTLDEPGLIRSINPYDYLIKLPFDTTYYLYYTHHNSQRWLIKLNTNLNTVLDSLNLESNGRSANVFAYHPQRNRFYCMHVNYELHTGEIDSIYKSREDYGINPDVSIYDPQTLELVERYSITDYPEGNYPGYDGGLGDVVGDFIVYYFFREEVYNYHPAMLFIFDTRTNEATWLRVGWR